MWFFPLFEIQNYDLILTDHDLPSANKKTKPWVRILVQGDFV